MARQVDYDRPMRDGDKNVTKDGRRIVPRKEYDRWIQAAQINFDRYRCLDCGSIVWHTKGKVVDITLPCGEPCRGVMRKVAVPMGGENE